MGERVTGGVEWLTVAGLHGRPATHGAAARVLEAKKKTRIR